MDDDLRQQVKEFSRKKGIRMKRAYRDLIEHGLNNPTKDARVWLCPFCDGVELAAERPEMCRDCGVEGSGFNGLGEPRRVDS